jgi:hypothetical protein
VRPDIPGTFLIDFGFNRGISRPTNFSQGFWGSRTLNIYYHYPIRIAKTKFSYNPGAGFSFERFKMGNNYTLSPTANADGSYSLIQSNTLYQGVKKNMLVMNYFDVMPVAFRFDTRPEDMARSFSVTVGGRVGVLYDSYTKMKYSVNGDTKKVKDYQSHGLNSFRYSMYGRIGIGGFNFFGFYNFSPLFAANKGPDKTTMNTFTMGISIDGF